MATDLAELVEPLKRGIAVPGEFDTWFPNTADDDLTATLCDSFAECQLDGYFGELVLDLNTNLVTDDLSMAGRALVVIYASIRIIQSQIRQLTTTEKYKAGPVEYELGRSAGVLKAELEAMQARKLQLLAMARRSGRVTYVNDSYFARAFANWADIGSFYAYELV